MSESLSSSISNTPSAVSTESTLRLSSTSEAGSSSFASSSRLSTSTTTSSPAPSSTGSLKGTLEALPTPVPTNSPPISLPSSSGVLSSAAPTESVNHLAQDSSHGSARQLSTLKIVAISVSAGILLILIIGLIVYLVLRSRRSRSKRERGAPSQNVDAETLEKYGTPSEYTHLQYRQASAETKGSRPILKLSFDQNRRSSRYSSDFAEYHDVPPSPFVNGEIETTHQPLTHAISLADATPFSEHMDDAYLDAAPIALPNPHPPTKRASAQLPPITIPSSYNPPTRKPTAGKRVSRRSSRHTYRAVDTGDQSDGDSASLYSQASAYTMHSEGGAEDLTVDTVRPGPFTAPLPSALQDKRDSSASTIRPLRARSPAPAPVPSPVRPEAEVPTFLERAPSENGTETTGELSRENTVVVARLLKSRVRADAVPPARSGSVVSHIERKGSIRPALPTAAEGVRGVRALRALRKARGQSSVGVVGLEDIPQESPVSHVWQRPAEGV